MKVEQTAVNYKKDSPAASIEFNLITGKSQDWVFDIRSFSPRGKIGDLDVELKNQVLPQLKEKLLFRYHQILLNYLVEEKHFL